MSDSFESSKSEDYYSRPYESPPTCSKFLNKGHNKFKPPAPKSVKFERMTPLEKFNYVETKRADEIQETIFYNNDINKNSLDYLKELCVIEMTRLGFLDFENFLNSLNQDQLILYHETLSKTRKVTKNSKQCKLL